MPAQATTFDLYWRITLFQVALDLIGIAGSSELDALKILRALRTLRTLRTVSFIKGLQVMFMI